MDGHQFLMKIAILGGEFMLIRENLRQPAIDASDFSPWL